MLTLCTIFQRTFKSLLKLYVGSLGFQLQVTNTKVSLELLIDQLT
jgi:hypothetical protein